MSAPALIKQADAERILKAARKVGLTRAVRWPDGRLELIFDADAHSRSEDDANEWDDSGNV